ncbi:serine protease [Streptomyces sp. MUM 2J]|uniref:trypsin-like serine peptidase n=1 Tax=Streptomyces sp. MUM 2J TaxID=2791987 RepID=UPI001F03FDB6|nr:trypsin-like peptidase domain-containing protein [Streptomyces sp. MUM 2J]MCH0566132.1 trypsin-like peptidase domain-containing protein [Streptomyces sp. MUM 2J]
MDRESRSPGPRRLALFAALVLPVVTSSSLAVADAGTGPLGVTAGAVVSERSDRVGVLFRDGDDVVGGHFCTASVVHSPRRDLVLTAAHCLDGAGELLFAPGYRDGQAPHGVWKVARRVLPEGWAERQDEDSDVAFAVLEPDRAGDGIEDVVGAERFATGTVTGATAVTVTGYPSDGETPVTCTNKPTAQGRTQQRIECPGFSGGTSGSPWVNGDGKVVGVLGGHERGGNTDDVSYSVALGTEAARLYGEAVSAP